MLGPTNTGKTHLAIERLLAHSSGIIGLPLRLLAREVYNKIADRAGVDSVALITGEEKIKPKNPRFWVSTVEAMPRDLDVSFLAVDEIQIAADLERGHVFTDRILQPPRPRRDHAAGRRHHAPDHRAAAAGRFHRHAAAGCRSSNSPATARSRASRGAPRSSRSRPRRSTPSPN